MQNTILLAATPNLQASLDFYTKLNFNYFEINGHHYFEDGGMVIEVDGTKSSRNGIILYKADWKKEVQALRLVTEVIELDGVFLMNDFAGVRIQLVEGESNVIISDLAKSPSLFGNAAGLSLECISISQMYRIYKILGFRKTMGDEKGTWLSLVNEDKLTISIMSAGSCPHMFYNPSLTYFNSGKNLEVIDRLNKAQIPITEEITVFNKNGIVDNVIVRDPGGFGVFVFND